MHAPRIDPKEVVFTAIRAQGAGGQNVNKVSNAAQLRFDIGASRLPEALKARLRAWPDQRIGSDGVITIKAQDHRSLPLNQADALARLQALVDAAAYEPKKRRATRPTWGSQQRRLEGKKRRGDIKAGRRGDF
ncbi:aminoacyl-tRNA hydrolase [Ideonella sp. B7]|uniref:alternative ribosome rescue aminoacyl-tRNA hydrolase ArfB n=1 Tax=Ideonella benzenivorans TaxID=2831643 RepID=UPI001CEDE78A|nr:alternative ribosome rescue aminoacyl-tRNA hydrolase ArfB [Ideonella benzenivorans]MCA6218209.1 aminoacyl-tRNA hydrolase [Ideonella benzenivorans]